MADYEWEQFQDTGYNLTHLPQNTHLLWETTLYLYYVSADDNTQLWKYTKSTGIDAQLDVDPGDASGDNKSRLQPIVSAWYDIGTGIIWFVDLQARATPNTYYVWKLDISDDTATNIGDATRQYIQAIDIFVYDGNTYVIFWDFIVAIDPIGENFIRIYDVDTAPFVAKDTWAAGGGAPAGTIYRYTGVLIDDKFYWGIDVSDGDFFIAVEYDITGDSIGMPAGRANVSKADSESQHGLAYDDADILFMVLKKDGDGLDYLHKYSIDGDSWSAAELLDVALMVDRNCLETEGSPYEHEKGFHLTNSHIYQIQRGYVNLFKIQELGLTGGETIKAITDTLLITSDKDVYNYVNSISDFTRGSGMLRCWDVPSGKFSHAEELSANQLIEVFENNEENYTLCFRGKLGRPEYQSNERVFNYSSMNLGWDDLDEKVSYVASTEGIDDVVIALIGQLTNPYIYVDATSVPNIAINMTYTFDDVKLRDALYVCCILANGYFWIEPTGYLYFRTYSAMPLSKWYFNRPDDFNIEIVGTTGTDIAWFDYEWSNGHASYEAIIFAEEDGHKNVIKMTASNENNGLTYWHHNFTTKDADIFEYWFKYKDNGVGKFPLYGIGAQGYINGYVSSNDNKLYMDYGDGLGGSTQVNMALAADTWHHFKFAFDMATDKYSLWVNEVLFIDDENYYDDRTGIEMDYFRFAVYDADGLNDLEAYLDAGGEVSDSQYVEGYNLRDVYSLIAKTMSVPSLNILQVQHNDFSNIRGGWDNTNTKEFAPTTPLIEEHIQEYGKLLWRGRKSFVGAITQVSLDAIITALKIWEGMITNPLEISFYIKDRYYYPVGYKCALTFSQISALNFTTIEDFLIIQTQIDFLRKGADYITISNNITRRESK